MKATILLAVAMMLTACVESNSTGMGPGVNPAQYQATADAAQVLAGLAHDSTRQAQAARQAEAAIQAVGTSSAKDATIAAVEVTRAAGEAQVLALELRSTEIAQNLRLAAATSTAVYNNQLSTREAQDVYMRRMQEAQEFNRKQRSKMIGSLVMYALLLLIATAVLSAGVYLAKAYAGKQQRPIYHVPTPGGGVLAVVSSGWQELPSTAVGHQLMLPPGEPMRALPAPTDEPIRLPQLRTGHVFVVGEQGAGKSNALKVLAGQRRGVTVFDPHYRPGTWQQHVNLIKEWDELENALREMSTVLDARIAAGHRGDHVFTNRTIVVDELPVLAGRLGSDLVWGAFERWLQEARKYRLYIILGSQTAQVRPLKLQGKSVLFQNFTAKLYLGEAARKLDRELVHTMDRPALLQLAGKDPIPVIVPYDPMLDPESTRFVPPSSQTEQDELDAVAFNTATLSDLTSRNKAALFLAGRDNGRASGQEYDRLDAALRHRAQVMNCVWAQGLLREV